MFWPVSFFFWCKALVFQRAVGFISAIATIIGFWWTMNTAVVCRYNGVHMTHATITYLNRFFMKYSVEWVRRGKMSIKKILKDFINVSFDIHGIRWTEPNGFSTSSVFLVGVQIGRYFKNKTGVFWKSTFFKASLYVLMLLFKISWFDVNLEIILLITLGTCFLILGGWVEFILVYIGLSLGFLNVR